MYHRMDTGMFSRWEVYYYLVLLCYRLQYLSLKPYTEIPKISNTGTMLLSGQRPYRYRQHVKLQVVSSQKEMAN